MPREKVQHLKQRKDGRYCAVYHGIQFMGNTEEEALEARAAYRLAEQTEDIPVSSITVYDYALKWLPIYKAGVAKNTYNAYASYISTLIKHIGEKKLAEVTPSDIKSVYNEYLFKSESAIRKAKMLFTSLWDCAIEDHLVKFNPCRTKSARPHKGTKGTHRALTEEEDYLIRQVDTPLRLGVLTMRYAGLRRGEALALNIDKDVDFERKVITVRNSVRFVGNHYEIVDPKSEAGKREVPLLDILANELQGHHGLLIPTAHNQVMNLSSWQGTWASYLNNVEIFLNGGIRKRWFHLKREWQKDHPREYLEYKRLLNKDPNEAEKYRLRDWKTFKIRTHDLRHSYCTMLRDNDVDMKLAITWMGHADERMVLEIYDHGSKKRMEKTIERLNNSIK